MKTLTRREALRLGLLTGMTAWANVILGGCGSTDTSPVSRSLQPPDSNGVMLPKGLSSRIVARSGQAPVTGGSYLWHAAPDGGACFGWSAGSDSGWIYVSNSEVSAGGGGVGALKFDASGEVIDAYSLLQGSYRNCAGGATPWGSWLSCEEVDVGQVWECDPNGVNAALALPALGRFNHEAVAVDPLNHCLYLTEDKPDGGFYRFRPDSYPDLGAGTLEIARLDGTKLGWEIIADPAAGSLATRYQQPGSAMFDGGEGIVYHDGQVYFTTKGDNRVWRFDPLHSAITVVYDAADYLSPVLTGVDNITASADGSLYVAEDGGDLQVVVITMEGDVYPLLQLVGHDSSEITGVAFSPDGSRLYFSSQRGTTGVSEGGVTFEISGLAV